MSSIPEIEKAGMEADRLYKRIIGAVLLCLVAVGVGGIAMVTEPQSVVAIYVAGLITLCSLVWIIYSMIKLSLLPEGKFSGAEEELKRYRDLERDLRASVARHPHLKDLSESGEFGAVLHGLRDDAQAIAQILALWDEEVQSEVLALCCRMPEFTQRSELPSGESFHAHMLVIRLLREQRKDRERIAELELTTTRDEPRAEE